MSGSGVIAGDQLRTIVERIEYVENKIKELTEAKKEIYFEAKGSGFNVKILREVIRVRKQDQKDRDEQNRSSIPICMQSKRHAGLQRLRDQIAGRQPFFWRPETPPNYASVPMRCCPC